jgi:hypothetical protein
VAHSHYLVDLRDEKAFLEGCQFKQRIVGDCPWGVTSTGRCNTLPCRTDVDCHDSRRSEAGRGEFSATRSSDLNIVHIGDERYEIPEALPFGG